MRDNDPSAYDGTAQDLQREASGVTAGDLPLLFAAIVIGGVVGLFNRLRRHKPEQPQAEPQPAAPAPASSHAPLLFPPTLRQPPIPSSTCTRTAAENEADAAAQALLLHA
ncbi:MAG: hypothetical protein HWD60_10350 [Defluviicoccus sp.]|nr:MAG: hypothetical protein HWD60_10350 [Defluviicoccus sp.]